MSKKLEFLHYKAKEVLVFVCNLMSVIAGWISKMVQFRQCFDAAERSHVKVPTSVPPTVIGKNMSIGTCFAVQ